MGYESIGPALAKDMDQVVPGWTLIVLVQCEALLNRAKLVLRSGGLGLFDTSTCYVKRNNFRKWDGCKHVRYLKAQLNRL